jgi:shikimate kinase
MNIVLIGFMGSGKSTIAKHVSQRLQREWVEMDALVLQKTNTRTMHEVFALGGELLLRETEIALAKEISVHPNLVISTGAGIVQNRINLDYFKKAGASILFLHAQFATIAKRIGSDTSRPLFQDISSAQKLYQLRLPLYFTYADQVIDVDTKSPELIAQTIQEMQLYGV